MKAHRSVLEVLAFLPPVCVDQSAALVCRQWSKISLEDELWQVFADSQFIDLGMSDGKTKKERFTRLLSLTNSLPILTGQKLHWFNINTKHWHSHASNEPITSSLSSFLVNSGRGYVLAIGGSQPAHHKFVYRLQRSEATRLTDMIMGRKSPGAVLFYEDVYVFGGKDNKTSERLSLLSESWKRLSDMENAKYDFTPCVYQTDIYLCGTGENYRYSPLNDQFSQFTFNNGLRGYALVLNQELLFISGHNFTRFDLETGKSSTKDYPEQWGYGAICTQGLISNGSVWVTFNSAVLQLDLESRETTVHERP